MKAGPEQEWGFGDREWELPGSGPEVLRREERAALQVDPVCVFRKDGVTRGFSLVFPNAPELFSQKVQLA